MENKNNKYDIFSMNLSSNNILKRIKNKVTHRSIKNIIEKLLNNKKFLMIMKKFLLLLMKN